MNVYCGTDIIEVERIKKAIEKNSLFLSEIYSQNEICNIEKTHNEIVRYQRYAGRYAAKEAIYKAISKIVIAEKYTPGFLDVEICNDDDLKQRPYVNVLSEELKRIFSKYNVKIDLSISHIKSNAIAMAVVNIDEDKE